MLIKYVFGRVSPFNLTNSSFLRRSLFLYYTSFVKKELWTKTSGGAFFILVKDYYNNQKG